MLELNFEPKVKIVNYGPLIEVKETVFDHLRWGVRTRSIFFKLAVGKLKLQLLD